jgi:hypothetical protein
LAGLFGIHSLASLPSLLLWSQNFQQAVQAADSDAIHAKNSGKFRGNFALSVKITIQLQLHGLVVIILVTKFPANRLGSFFVILFHLYWCDRAFFEPRNSFGRVTSNL